MTIANDVLIVGMGTSVNAYANASAIGGDTMPTTTINVPNSVHKAILRQSRLYVLDGYGLSIFANATTPTLVARLDLNAYIRDMALME